MEPLNQVEVSTPYGNKIIAVYNCDVLDFDEEIQILTTSSYYRSYTPSPGTMFAALASRGIYVTDLSKDPEMDLRELCNVWLSKEIRTGTHAVRRLGCIEMTPYIREQNTADTTGEKMLCSIQAYFQMLDIAGTFGIKMDTVAIPLLGAGRQHISAELTAIPLLNECLECLKRNPHVKRILFIEKNPANEFKMAMALEKSYTMVKEKAVKKAHATVGTQQKAFVFISYSSRDKNIADHLCMKLEEAGIKAWYAPRDIASNDYASAIVSAITRCTHFVVIISKNSLASQHVLNEIDLAFRELNRNIRFLPLRIDEEDMAPAFTYYLSRQHWVDVHVPPIEQRLDEFVKKIIEEL